jgi:two-component system chemotaxis response regulator CheB
MELTTSSSRGFSGTVNLELHDLIQMVCISRSDLTISVTSTRARGVIYVKSGQICHAQLGTVQGEPAFFEMLLWKDGRFEMLPFEDPGVNTLNRAWEYLLLEAMRQRDEKAATQATQKDAAGNDGLPEASEPVEADQNADAESENGSTFQRTVAQPAPADLVVWASGESPKTEKIKVLIVDDSAFFARRLKSMFEADPQIEVVADARNGKEAVEFLSSHQAVDLITLDVEMPVMPGDSTLKHIMVRFGVPVVMLSSFQTRSLSNIVEFLQLGAVDFFQKPGVKEDMAEYGSNLCDLLKRVARSQVSHFRRLRKLKNGSDDSRAARSNRRIMLIAGAEGAYMDWFRLPLQRLSRYGLVIGLQKLPDLLLPGFSKLVQNHTSSPTEPLMHSEWVNPGVFYLGNAASRVNLKLLTDQMSLGIEIAPSEELFWHEGIPVWISQLAEQAGPRLSICLLSAARRMAPMFIERLLQYKVQLILSPPETLLCPDLVESILPYSESSRGQVTCGRPENLVEVWLGYDSTE